MVVYILGFVSNTDSNASMAVCIESCTSDFTCCAVFVDDESYEIEFYPCTLGNTLDHYFLRHYINCYLFSSMMSSMVEVGVHETASMVEVGVHETASMVLRGLKIFVIGKFL